MASATLRSVGDHARRSIAAVARRAYTPPRRWSIRFSQPVIWFQLALVWSTILRSRELTNSVSFGSASQAKDVAPDRRPNIRKISHVSSEFGWRNWPLCEAPSRVDASFGLSSLGSPFALGSVVAGGKGTDAVQGRRVLLVDDLWESGSTLWDGKSKGTVNNVVNLSRDHQPVVVYVAPTKQFRTINTFDDLDGLLAQGDSGSVERIVSELDLHVALAGLASATCRDLISRYSSTPHHTEPPRRRGQFPGTLVRLGTSRATQNAKRASSQ